MYFPELTLNISIILVDSVSANNMNARKLTSKGCKNVIEDSASYSKKA